MTVVSKFNSVNDTNPKDIKIEDWLGSTMDKNNPNTIKVLKYRLTKKDSDKIKLPCITISASFKNYRDEKHINKKNNFICLDVDRNSKSKKKTSNICIDMQRAKDFFASHPCCLFTGFSTGNDGVYAIIRLKYNNQLEKYFEHFKVKLAKIGINIDASCKDYARLRFFSFDPDAYYNPKAKYYNIKKETQERHGKSISTGKKSDIDKVEAILAIVEQHGIDITSEYEDWVKIGGALYAAFGEGGRDYFHSFSKYHPEYKFKKTDRKFDSCKKLTRIDFSSLFYIAGLYGVRY